MSNTTQLRYYYDVCTTTTCLIYGWSM